MSKKPTILSGMRSTGQLHIGHYHGVIKNWIALQDQFDIYLFAADWHALTTDYAAPGMIEKNTRNMIIDWLACGIDPDKAHIFIQSRIPEHAELHLLLSMITPLSWLERVPTYKDQQQQLKNKDLATYGFLGYPLLQAADILLYQCEQVPVGQDQVPHIELTREVARRFNYLYGREANHEALAIASMKKLGKSDSKTYKNYFKAYQERGDHGALTKGHDLIKAAQNLSHEDKERLLGYLEGVGKTILKEPKPLLTKVPVFPGLDGRKMSKSYHNTIGLRDEMDVIEKKIKTMPTDPARIRRSDPGNPEKCPVWEYHKIYSDDTTKKWVWDGCITAGIGCVDCKKPISDAIISEQKPIAEKARHYENHPELVNDIIEKGGEKAREKARNTMKEVRKVMGV